MFSESETMDSIFKSFWDPTGVDRELFWEELAKIVNIPKNAVMRESEIKHNCIIFEGRKRHASLYFYHKDKERFSPMLEIKTKSKKIIVRIKILEEGEGFFDIIGVDYCSESGMKIEIRYEYPNPVISVSSMNSDTTLKFIFHDIEAFEFDAISNNHSEFINYMLELNEFYLEFPSEIFEVSKEMCNQFMEQTNKIALEVNIRDNLIKKVI